MADGKDKLLEGLLDIANGLTKLGQFIKSSVEACSVSEPDVVAAPKSRRPSAARLASQKRAREKAAAVILATATAIAPNTPSHDVKMTDPADDAAPLVLASRPTNADWAAGSKPGSAKAVDSAKSKDAGKTSKSTKKPKSSKKKISVLAINPEAPTRTPSKVAGVTKPAASSTPASKSPSATKGVTPSSPGAKSTAEKKPVTPKSLPVSKPLPSKPKSAAKMRMSVKAQALAADIARKEAEAQKQAETEAQKQIELQKTIDAEKDKHAQEEEDDDEDSDDESFMSASVSDEDSVSESESDVRSASDSEVNEEKVDSPRTPPGTVFKKVELAGRKRSRTEDADDDNGIVAKTAAKKASGANGKGMKRKRLNADMTEQVETVLIGTVKQNPNWAGPQIAKHITESLDVSENQCRAVLRRLVIDGVLSSTKGKKGYEVVDKTDAHSSSPTMNVGTESPSSLAKSSGITA